MTTITNAQSTLSKAERKELRRKQNQDWKIRTKNLVAKLDEDDVVYDPVMFKKY